MQYRILGNSGLLISAIGFGCMSLSTEDSENDKLIGRAIDLGINLFDTADVYTGGLNELSLGKAIRQKRHEVILATKVGNRIRSDGSGLDWVANKEYILGAADRSLQRLKTDYIDLYQLHGGTIEDAFDEVIEAFERLQHQGKIRFYGISSIRPNVITKYVRESKMASAMLQYSLLDRRGEAYCIPLLADHQIGVLTRGVLAKGLLINKSPSSYLDHSLEEVQSAAKLILDISGSQRNPAQTAIQFVLGNPGVSTCVVGIRNIGQLEEAAEVFLTPALSETERKLLSESVSIKQYTEHTQL